MHKDPRDGQLVIEQQLMGQFETQAFSNAQGGIPGNRPLRKPYSKNLVFREPRRPAI